MGDTVVISMGWQNRLHSAFKKNFEKASSCINLDIIKSNMSIEKLKMVLDDDVPLYSLSNGTRYQYTDSREHEQLYVFVKHVQHEFPSDFRLSNRNIVSYQYMIAIPDTHAHLVIFVDETAIVKPLIFK